jgi:hypothetical protein
MSGSVIKLLIAAAIFFFIGIYDLCNVPPNQPTVGFLRDISWLAQLFHNNDQGWASLVAAGVSMVLAYIFWWLDRNSKI